MAATKTEANPFIRRSFIQRVAAAGRYLLRLPMQAWRGYRNWPRGLRHLITVLGVTVLFFGAYRGGMYWYQRSKDKEVQAEKIAFNEALNKGEPKDKLLEFADRILKLDPGELQTIERRKAIETGSGDPKDVGIMMYLFRVHQQAKDTASLERECLRRLDYEKRDYYAHYLLVTVYLNKIQSNDPKKDVYAQDIIAHLDALGFPEANRINLFPAVWAASFQLLKDLRRPVDRLRSFTAEHIAPVVKSQGVEDFDTDLQAIVLYLFSETFELQKLPAETGLVWPYAAKLMETSLQSALAKGDVNTLRNLASLGQAFSIGLTKMRAESQITEAQQTQYGAELEDRVRKAWNAVLAKEPKNALAYFGLVQSYARTGMARETTEALHRGLLNCGDNPQLLQIFSNLSILNDQESNAYHRLKEAAGRNPGMPLFWVLAARAAEKIPRRDWAVEALENALVEVPRMRDSAARKSAKQEIIVMMAMLYTGTGNPEKVLHSLSELTDAELVYMPQACAIFSRALAEIGDTERLDAFLTSAAELSQKTGNWQPAYYCALGASEAYPPNAARFTRLADYLEPITRRWRIESPPASQLYAHCLTKAADLAPGLLDPVAARHAAIACENALSLDPNHVPTLANLAYLRLRGDKDPTKAIAEIGPMISNENVSKLTSEQSEVIGMVYVANKQFDNAVRILRAATTSRATSGCWIQLALAYHGQGRSEEAESALRNASQLPMSDRERNDYSSARDLLSRVKQ